MLKTLAAAGGGITAAAFLPGSWTKPVVKSGVLPAHAAASGSTGFQLYWFDIMPQNGGSYLLGDTIYTNYDHTTISDDPNDTNLNSTRYILDTRFYYLCCLPLGWTDLATQTIPNTTITYWIETSETYNSIDDTSGTNHLTRVNYGDGDPAKNVGDDSSVTVDGTDWTLTGSGTATKTVEKTEKVSLLTIPENPDSNTSGKQIYGIRVAGRLYMEFSGITFDCNDSDTTSSMGFMTCTGAVNSGAYWGGWSFGSGIRDNYCEY